VHGGSGASADNSLRSAAEALKGTLVSDGKRLEIRHFCFAACGSSIRQEVFAGPKSLDAPEPAESDLLALLQPHYTRAEHEGRTLLHELFAAAGDIRVCDSELHITLAPLSSPHRTRAAQALCELLDQTATTFPGSRLRIRFAVRPPPCIGLAFPGSPVHRSTAPAAPQPIEPYRTGHLLDALCQEV
jgi:hypothetical protein